MSFKPRIYFSCAGGGCGGGGKGRAANRNKARAGGPPSTATPNGTTRIRYVGGNTGTEMYYGCSTNLPYSFGGSKKFGFVHNADLECNGPSKGFLQITEGGRLVFEQAPLGDVPQAPQAASEPTAEPVKEEGGTDGVEALNEGTAPASDEPAPAPTEEPAESVSKPGRARTRKVGA